MEDSWRKLGVVDFAGGIVVHISAGFAALASVFIVGKRKILPAEKTQPHNITYVALGTGLLWFGWFGFNGGSALAANGIGIHRLCKHRCCRIHGDDHLVVYFLDP